MYRRCVTNDQSGTIAVGMSEDRNSTSAVKAMNSQSEKRLYSKEKGQSGEGTVLFEQYAQRIKQKIVSTLLE